MILARGFYPGLSGAWAGSRAEGNYERAEALLRESLAYCREQREKTGIATCFEDLAGLAGRTDRFERAARLFGASAALRGIVGEADTFWTREGYEADLGHVRQSLGPNAFAGAVAAGRQR